LITLYTLYLFTIFLIYKLGSEVLEVSKSIFLLKIKSDRISINLILGFFFLNFLAFFLNFFVSLNDYLILFILFKLTLILILRLNRKDIKVFIIFAVLIIFTIPMIINHDIGHDAGLYHVPFQNWIKSYKVTFGLYNLHSRYALNTSYDYISSLFWIGNNFTIVSFFQAIYLNIFILFFFELSKEKNNFSLVIFLPTTLSFLLWLRYSNIDYGGVDFSFGILAILFCLQTIVLLSDKQKEFNNSNFWIYFFIFCSVLVAKPTGAVFFFLFLFLLIFFYSYKKILILKYKQLNFIFILLFITLLWFIKNFIISGCFLYPVKYSCFDVSWFNKDYLIRDLILIQNYKRHFVDINFDIIKKNLNFLNIFLLIIIFWLSYFFFQKLNKKLSLLFFLISCLLIFFNFSFDSLRGFTSISTDELKINNIKISNQIIINEINRIIIVYSLICIAIIFLLRFLISNNKIFKFNFINFFILLFYLFLFSQWYLLSPDPRLGFWLIALLPTLFLSVFLNKINYKISAIKIFKINNSVLAINLFMFFLYQSSQLNLESFSLFSYKRVLINNTVLKERIYFGFTPVNYKTDNDQINYTWNFCWNIKDCYFNEDEMKLNNYFLNYKIVKIPIY
jgi:hypothetical protein